MSMNSSFFEVFYLYSKISSVARVRGGSVTITVGCGVSTKVLAIRNLPNRVNPTQVHHTPRFGTTLS